jgi:CheY-like chemotaxis protein
VASDFIMTSTSTKPQPIPSKRILVVEDELLVAQTIRMALAADGHKVEIAANGEQALAMFAAGEYELVVTDFQLGKMDGLELAQAVKERVPTCPTILITAYAETVLRGGKVSNVDHLLGKPFSLTELHRALRKVFSGSGN